MTRITVSRWMVTHAIVSTRPAFSSDAAFVTTRRSGSVSSAKSLGQKQAQINDFCLVDLRTVTGLTCA